MTDKKECEDCNPIVEIIGTYIVLAFIVFLFQAVISIAEHRTFCHTPTTRWVLVFPTYYLACYMGEKNTEETNP
jgi:hypothetical protein